jgi:hypothetical protein
MAQPSYPGAAVLKPAAMPDDRLVLRHPLPGFLREGDPGAELARRMAVVKRARFNGHKRLEARERFSAFTLSMFALYAFGAQLWGLIFARNDAALSNMITFLTMFSAEFALIVGLLAHANDYASKAKFMHRCGHEVNRLLHELQTLAPTDTDTLALFSRRFDDILGTYPDNHDDIDHQHAVHGWNSVRWHWWWDVYGLYGLILLVPPISVVAFLVWRLIH